MVSGRGCSSRPAWAEVDLAALRRNVAALAAFVSPALVCAVVKADAYGHGAVAVAREALDAGASWLAVALVEEGVELREAGIEAPVLLLSEPPPGAMEEAVARRITPSIYSAEGLSSVAALARHLDRRVGIHLKVDTGMHRVGSDPLEVPALARSARDAPGVYIEGLWTHLAVADGASRQDREFTQVQLSALAGTLSALRAEGIDPPLVHAANSAGAIAHRGSRLGMVRCGIALYGALEPLGGCDEPGAMALQESLQPVMSLRARVSALRELPRGARPSYGRLRPLEQDSVVATVPLGYADGVPRRWFSNGGTVLVGGEHRPLAGMVTMDQIVVDCGPGSKVRAGDEVVLIGRQGVAELNVLDWASRLGTISYEVLCGIGPRVPRVFLNGSREDRHEGQDEEV